VALNEVAPPGFGHTKSGKGDKKGGTAAAFDRARKEGRFKGSKSDMFAIMWSQKNKGDKPHYKPGTDKKYKKYQEESFEINKSAHKAAQKKTKMRNLARGNENPNEKAAAEKKAGGPKLVGEEDNYKVRNKELKRTKNARDQRYKTLHTKTDQAGNVDVNEIYDNIEGRAKESQKFHTFYKKARDAKARKQADSTRSDSRIRGVKFADAKGTGRIRGGKKVYD